MKTTKSRARVGAQPNLREQQEVMVEETTEAIHVSPYLPSVCLNLFSYLDIHPTLVFHPKIISN